ncbi:Tumor-associated calcium signal transducer 2 precursor [Salmo salar]|uniref:Tumor-associated calcium signal transducer 2 n=1 Tax=Salmo salar TaxID=8030 RepID=B5XFC3_SALSA|nr:Tumor-associated calcium signal transducer 2 precursor [Salmo salar]ACI69543.1 Tumor-associated calcium signal transducer 2 precursor [Salmo salar]|eukprot:NP_001134932.1 Tumor-associated calcium signal transducer 2 precursor [Salmo salar]
MTIWIALLLATFAVGASAQCKCDSMKWATCDGTPCTCSIMVEAGMAQNLNCSTLIPKCYLMKAEMYRAKNNLSTRTGGKPVETAFVDNDGIYDPVCEATGAFRAKQCNNTEECWCVNSAGVRRTDKGDKSLKCEKLVETYWVRLELKHKEVSKAVDASKLQAAIANAIETRYSFDKTLVKEVEYDPDARMIIVDVQKAKGDRKADLSRMAYYMEKDVKVLPLFANQEKFAPSVDGQKLEMENILVYYVDEEAPTFTMKKLTGGIIAVIVVVILAVVAGLLVLFFARKREQKYSKAEPREMEAL